MNRLCRLYRDFPAYVERYLWPLPKFRREVVVMVDGRYTHGGLTDRFRHILSVYDFCRQNGLRFRLWYCYPCDLRLWLEPAEYDWRIDRKDLSFSCYDSREVSLWVDPVTAARGEEEIRRRHLEKLESIAKSRRCIQYHVIGNTFLSRGRYRALFFELFRPSERLATALDAVQASLPPFYEAAVFRFRNLMGDFPEKKAPVLPEAERELLLEQCIEKLKELYRQGGFSTQRILVTSDSATFLQCAARLPFVDTLPGHPVHVDCARQGDPKPDLKSLVDLYMLMRSRRITLLLTGNMYDSGFPRFAAELGGCPFETLRF